MRCLRASLRSWVLCCFCEFRLDQILNVAFQGLRNFALATMSVEDFEKRMSLGKINDLFLMLRKRISESGTYFELAAGYYGFVEL